MPSTSTVYSAQGATCSWNGHTLGKVTSIKATAESPPKEIRALANNVDESLRYLSIYEQTTCEQSMDCDIILSSSSTITSDEVGSVGSLSFSGTGFNLSFPHAIMTKFSADLKVADVIRVQVSFKRTYS